MNVGDQKDKWPRLKGSEFPVLNTELSKPPWMTGKDFEAF